MEVVPFQAEHAAAVASLCRDEGWDYWDDLATVTRALSAPGATTLVAVEGDEVVGGAQVLSDGEINWVLGMLIVKPSHRGRGIGKRLVAEAMTRTDARRLDLLTEDDGPQVLSLAPRKRDERLPALPDLKLAQPTGLLPGRRLLSHLSGQAYHRGRRHGQAVQPSLQMGCRGGAGIGGDLSAPRRMTRVQPGTASNEYLLCSDR
jgi:GNAT superfamily N-acetyltransferase